MWQEPQNGRGGRFVQLNTSTATPEARDAVEAVRGREDCFAPLVDRGVGELSPIEHGVLLIGLYELQHCVDVPYRVAINEAVELAKSFGGTDGHKYVNGVLDKVAADLRPDEAKMPHRSTRRAS